MRLPTMVVYGELPKSIRLGGSKSIPGYLLAKLGLDRSLRGRGLGADLLLDALAMVVRAADAAGGRVIVVDSLPIAKVHDFYCSADFRPLPGSYRLWMKTSTAREVT
jgi:GNAT superfamily N-acetyltransferase